ncbi:MAG: YceD family protein [Bacillota bacterium]
MKINISPIREIRGGVINFEGRQEAPDFKMDLHFTCPVEIQGTVTNTGEGFLVKARVTFSYKVNCSRCLKEFTANQETEVLEQFVPGPVNPEDDELVSHFNGDYIDLKEFISEELLLSLPMNFICSPECRGLCPTCGKDLNQGNCQCVPEQTNPQFEKLRNLLSIEGGGLNGKSKK